MDDAEKPAKAVLGRPFTKGVSGNPSGRPKEVESVKMLARQHTEAAILALVSSLSARGPVRVAAAIAILDRAWGKPSQSLTGEGGEGPVVVTYRWARDDSWKL